MDARKVLVSGLLVSAAAGLPAGEAFEDRLEEAFFREVALADAEGAIAAYRAILADPSSPPRALALAHLRLGICLARRGEDEEARRHLYDAIEKHPLDEEAAATARELLGREARPDPARFFPPDVLVYVELVDPSAHTGRIASLVEGTPLQNPVDTYVSYLARRGADSAGAEPSRAPADSPPAAAFFNEGFLTEIAKIGGLAAAVPGGRRSEREFVGVFFPGRSDILRGLVQMFLALSRAEGVGRVAENALLRARPEGEGAPEDPDEWIHVSLGPKAVVFGTPRRLVEEAVLREAGGADSLAGDPDFLRARAARAGSLLFSYIRRGRALEAAASGLEAQARPGFEALRSALALDAVDSVSVTAAYEAAADAMKLTARARIGPD
ncbi:MAG: tetratricopeptide repeat protein, partial [Planctomycetota bacterium]